MATPETPKTENNQSATRSAMQIFNVSAYSINAPDMSWSTGKTATGTQVQEGRTIATDPNVIPLGSQVELICPRYPSVNGVYIAEDTGGAIKGNKLDLYIHSAERAVDFGRRQCSARIL